MKLGIEQTAMVRVRAGISYALTEAMDERHCISFSVHDSPLKQVGQLSQSLPRSAAFQ